MEKKHKEELGRLAAEAEADRLKTQSRSAQERQDLEEAR